MNRMPVFDIAKALAILFVLIGHTDTQSFLCFFVHLFHMQFFFVLAGYFFHDENCVCAKTLKDFISKKIKRLYFPYITINLTFLYAHNLFHKLNFYTTNPAFLDGELGNHFGLNTGLFTLKQFIIKTMWTILGGVQEPLCGPTWFLKVLLFCLIIMSLITYFKSKTNKEISRFCFVLIFILLGYYLSLLKINIYMIGTIFSALLPIYTGILLNRFNCYKYLTKRIWFFSFAILLILTFTLKLKVNLSANFYYNPLLLCISSICGFYFVMGIAKFIEQHACSQKIKSLLIYIGQHTIIILCLHLLAFKLVTWLQILYYNLPSYRLASYFAYKVNVFWIFMYVLAGIILPLLYEMLYNKIKNKIC